MSTEMQNGQHNGKKQITLETLESPTVNRDGTDYRFSGKFKDVEGGRIYGLYYVSVFPNGWRGQNLGHPTEDLSSIIKKEFSVEVIGPQYGRLYTQIGDVPATVIQFTYYGD